MVIEDVIVDLGWDIVGPAMRLSEAVAFARESDFDAALLDVNLDGEMSWDVGAMLQQRGIPFAFTTGYDGSTVLPEQFDRQPIINKPFSAHDIGRALQKLIG